MSTNLTKLPDVDAVERTLIQGDLAKLNPEQRIVYYRNLCESLGMNSMTRPFEYITLGGRLVLYCRKDGTDQLRKIYNVSVIITSRSTENEIHTVCARATLPDGRTDESVGSVNIAGLRGDALANAIMKAETKAKRRVTLSICGLGFLDESEVETIPKTRVDLPKEGPRPLKTTTVTSDFAPVDLLAPDTSISKANAFLRVEKPQTIVKDIAEALGAEVVEEDAEVWDLANYVVDAGRFKGMKLGAIPEHDLKAYLPIVRTAPNEHSREIAKKIDSFLKLQGGMDASQK